MTVLYFRVLLQIDYMEFIDSTNTNNSNSICVIYTFIMDMCVNNISI